MNNRNGQLLSVKAIAYLVLSVIAIIAAVMLLSKVYQALIGGEPAKQDAALLADVINRMIKDERQYLQVPILLRLEDKRIVGFGDGERFVRIETVTTSSAGVGAPGQTTVKVVEIEKVNCDGACICTTENDKTKSCFMLVQPTKGNQQRSLTLATNYYPYENKVKALVTDTSAFFPSNMPKDQAGILTDFIIDRGNIPILTLTDKRSLWRKIKTVTDDNTPIIPLIVEKITDPSGNVLITVMPESDHMRAREAYLYVCPAKSEPKCVGKTFVTSLTGDQTNACSANRLHPECKENTIEPCEYNRLVTAPCKCGNKVALYGVCFNNGENRKLRCDTVTQCEDYCTQNGGDDCDPNEMAGFCSADPCQIARQGTRCAPDPGILQSIVNTINNNPGPDPGVAGTFNSAGTPSQTTDKYCESVPIS